MGSWCYDKMIKDLAKSDMVVFGEYHFNSDFTLVAIGDDKSFFGNEKATICLSVPEMFESGNQFGSL